MQMNILGCKSKTATLSAESVSYQLMSEATACHSYMWIVLVNMLNKLNCFIDPLFLFVASVMTPCDLKSLESLELLIGRILPFVAPVEDPVIARLH